MRAGKELTDTGWALAGKVGTGICQIVASVFLAKILVPEQFGLFQVILRIVAFGSIIGSFGLGLVAVKFVVSASNAESNDNEISAATSLLLVTLLVSILTALGFLFVREYLLPGTDTSSSYKVHIYIAILLVVASFQQVMPELFRGLSDIKLASIFGGLSVNTLFMILTLAFFIIDIEANVVTVVQVFSAAVIVVFILSLKILFKKLNWDSKKIKLSRVNIYEIYVVALPVYFSSILLSVVSQADVLIVARLVSYESAGLYAIASKLALLLGVPLMVATAVIKPRVAKSINTHNHAELQHLATWTCRLTLLTSVVLAVFTLLFSDGIINYLFGAAYTDAQYILYVLVFGQVLMLGFGPCGVIALMGGRQRKLLTASLIGAIVFVGCAVISAKIWGAFGVAGSAVIASVVTHCLLAVDIYKVMGIKTYFHLN